MDNLILVNKYNKLHSNYVPEGLIEITDFIESTIIEGNMKVNEKAYNAFLLLQKEALKNGHQIFINSAYRSYKDQKKTLINFIDKLDYEEAISRVALPGHSEHQTGLAIDFAILESIDEGGKHYVKGWDMWEDNAANWVYQNAHRFGFILRYPKDKEIVTGQMGEPWHLRYVGTKHATLIYNMKFTLEEYLDYINKDFNKDTTKIPLIGIAGRVEYSDKNLPVISTGEFYRKSMVRNGASVITIQPPQDVVYNEITPRDVPRLSYKDKEILDNILSKLDGIILPGGSKWYEFDEYICEYALDHDIPLLGICLGMQTISYIDNRKARVPKFKTYINDSEIDHNQLGPEYVHAVNLRKGSKIYELLGQDTIMVNSRHSYNIGEENNEFKVYAYSSDGIPECIENGKNAMGVQWHPELMAEYDKNNQELMKYFVETCRKG